jgi:hypothetical protein
MEGWDAEQIYAEQSRRQPKHNLAPWPSYGLFTDDEFQEDDDGAELEKYPFEYAPTNELAHHSMLRRLSVPLSNEVAEGTGSGFRNTSGSRGELRRIRRAVESLTFFPVRGIRIVEAEP